MSKTTSHDSDVSFIRALTEVLRDNDLTELEVKREYGENDRLTVKVSKRNEVVAQVQTAAPAPAAAQAPAAPATPATPAATPDAAPEANAVTSPMVGTVYLQAEPGTPPFVSVGDRVAEGDTLLIIEAMKTMNQIPSPKAGVVRRILVEDGGPVDYGAPMMVIE